MTDCQTTILESLGSILADYLEFDPQDPQITRMAGNVHARVELNFYDMIREYASIGECR